MKPVKIHLYQNVNSLVRSQKLIPQENPQKSRTKHQPPIHQPYHITLYIRSHAAPTPISLKRGYPATGDEFNSFMLIKCSPGHNNSGNSHKPTFKLNIGLFRLHTFVKFNLRFLWIKFKMITKIMSPVAIVIQEDRVASTEAYVPHAI